MFKAWRRGSIINIYSIPVSWFHNYMAAYGHIKKQPLYVCLNLGRFQRYPLKNKKVRYKTRKKLITKNNL
jgi:hypothetical protein